MDTVPLDPIRALSTRKYLMLTASIYWRRLRKKLPKDFACDCGWRHVWGRFEHEHWNQTQTIVCYDCGDIYRTLHNTIVMIVPNPLNRGLISDRDRDGIHPDHPYANVVKSRRPPKDTAASLEDGQGDRPEHARRYRRA